MLRFHVKTVDHQYQLWICDQLLKFPDIRPAECGVTCSFVTEPNLAIRQSLISREKFDVLSSLNSVIFIHNDDPVNYDITEISFTPRAHMVFSGIENGTISLDDYEPETQLSVLLLKYIANRIDDSAIIQELLQKTLHTISCLSSLLL